MLALDEALRTHGFVAKQLKPAIAGGADVQFSTAKERTDFLLKALKLGDFTPYVRDEDFVVNLQSDGVNRICKAWRGR
jgi:hypothetical protein